MKNVGIKKAVANYCKGCIYDPLAGGTHREQIENCTIVRCELYEHRPRSSEVRAKQRADYLASLTVEQRIEEGRKSAALVQRLRDRRRGSPVS